MAGGDIRTFGSELSRAPAERQRGLQLMVERLHAAVEYLHRMSHPVVGQVQGAGLPAYRLVADECLRSRRPPPTAAYFASAYSTTLGSPRTVAARGHCRASWAYGKRWRSYAALRSALSATAEAHAA